LRISGYFHFLASVDIHNILCNTAPLFAADQLLCHCIALMYMDGWFT